MLGHRIENNNYQQSGDALLSDPSREIARVFLSNRIGEMVIYQTEQGHLSFGIQSSEEAEHTMKS
jgi:hypothetical protein